MVVDVVEVVGRLWRSGRGYVNTINDSMNEAGLELLGQQKIDYRPMVNIIDHPVK